MLGSEKKDSGGHQSSLESGDDSEEAYWD